LLFQPIPAANYVATRPDLKSHADAKKPLVMTTDAVRIPWSIVNIGKKKFITNSSLPSFFYARARSTMLR
jgi:hypothetical protein